MSEDLDPRTHTEYSGKVGHEKRIHKNQFVMTGQKLKSLRQSMYVWVKVKTGRWKLVRR